MNPRTRTPEPPYCWQSKEALRKIREHFDGDCLLPYALSVYCALTENASNKGEEEFTTLQSHLAQLAGVSVRTVRRVLPDLRQVGVIDYSTPRLRGPVIFRLLSVRAPHPHVASNRRNVRTNRPNVRPSKISAFQAANRNNNEVTNEITYSLRAERFEGGDSSLAAKIASAPDTRDAAFADFWAAYPRKVGKRDAKRAWAKLRPPLSEVLAALEVWRNSDDWRREGGRYIPHPTTWLNRGGWEDEAPAGADINGGPNHSFEVDRDRIIAENPLLPYCEAHGWQLKRDGRQWKCLCPLHEERTPSFTIDAGKRLWTCFGCGKGGSVIDLHAELNCITIAEAMRSLSRDSGNRDGEHGASGGKGGNRQAGARSQDRANSPAHAPPYGAGVPQKPFSVPDSQKESRRRGRRPATTTRTQLGALSSRWRFPPMPDRWRRAGLEHGRRRAPSLPLA